MFSVKTICAIAATAICVAAATPSAAATYLYTFTDDTGVVDASGQITSTGTPSGGFGEDITAISGTIFGTTITGLFNNPSAPNTNQYNQVIYDNQLNPASASGYISSPGLLVTTVGAELYNIYNNAGGTNGYQIFGTDASGAVNTGFTNGTFAITAVPEPAAWSLMLIGFAGLGGALRLARRSRPIAAS